MRAAMLFPLFGLSTVLCAAGAPAVAWAGPREDGLTALAAKDYGRAVELLGQARVEDPDDPDVAQSLGTALYRLGRFREAEQIFKAAAEASPDAQDKARARYNAGNAAYRGGRLDDALADYKQALTEDPAFEQAKQNAAAVEKEIQARRQPPPPESQEKDDAEVGGSQQEQAEGQTGSNGTPEPGKPQDGQEPQPGEGTREAEAGDAKPGEGEMKPVEGEGEGEGTEDGEGVAVGAGTEEGGLGGGMGTEEAERLVEGVTEGKPRVVVGEGSGGKDW